MFFASKFPERSLKIHFLSTSGYSIFPKELSILTSANLFPIQLSISLVYDAMTFFGAAGRDAATTGFVFFGRVFMTFDVFTHPSMPQR